MTMQIRKAERQQKKFKAALVGVSGSGKTWTALELATGLKNGGRILVVDTERSSSTLYADKFDFDVLDLPDSSVKSYLDALALAAKEKFDVVIIDSLSHSWEYLLEEVENVQKRDHRKNSFTAWSDVTPIYRQLVQGIVAAPMHVLATMRAKSEYVLEEYEAGGRKRTRPMKIGMAPVFRAGGEYEFDLVANIDLEHTFIVEKTRLDFLADKVITKPDRKLGEQIRDWLKGGAPVAAAAPVAKPETQEKIAKPKAQDAPKRLSDKQQKTAEAMQAGVAVEHDIELDPTLTSADKRRLIEETRESHGAIWKGGKLWTAHPVAALAKIEVQKETPAVDNDSPAWL